MNDAQKKRLSLIHRGILIGGGNNFCNTCEKELPLESFDKDDTYASGYRNVCRGCAETSLTDNTYVPPEETRRDARKLADWANEVLGAYLSNGGKRVPNKLMESLERHCPGMVRGSHTFHFVPSDN